jgi:hypothetical protein
MHSSHHANENNALDTLCARAEDAGSALAPPHEAPGPATHNNWRHRWTLARPNHPSTARAQPASHPASPEPGPWACWPACAWSPPAAAPRGARRAPPRPQRWARFTQRFSARRPRWRTSFVTPTQATSPTPSAVSSPPPAARCATKPARSSGTTTPSPSSKLKARPTA